MGINSYNKNESTINIYPMPAHDFFIIDTKGTDILKLTLTDITGKTLKSFESPSSVIYTENYKSGIYFLQIETLQGTQIKKFVIE